MNKVFSITSLCFLAVAILLTGCGQSLTISDVNYGQSLEAVLEPDEDGDVTDARNGIEFNVKPLQFEETEDTSSVTTEEIRMIRGSEGFYFITAPGYKNVYVMAPEANELKLENKIEISEDGLGSPAFNQRDSHIQLVDQETDETYSLDSEGLRESDNENDEEA